MATQELKVPDIGDFKDIPVIEILVKVGDTVAKEQSLVTLESDKATMEVPADTAGVVKELRVKLGDKVSQGTVVAMIEASVSTSATAIAPASAPVAAGSSPVKGEAGRGMVVGSPAPAKENHPHPNPPLEGEGSVKSAPLEGEGSVKSAPLEGEGVKAAGAYTGKADFECEVLVLGAGPGGYSAAFRSADLGMKTMIVERYAALGGVCLNVGCIPSKALLHTASVMDEVKTMAKHGITFAAPTIDMGKLREFKDGVVKKLTTGLSGMAKMRKVDVVRGYGVFIDPHHVEVEMTTGAAQEKSGEKKVIKFQKCIIAAGSQAVRLPFMPDDPRVVDSTGALSLNTKPERMLVIGGGIIGLEMATVYSALGARIDVVEMLDTVMTGADRDLVKVWEKVNAPRFDNMMLKTKTVAAEAKKDGIYVTFEGADDPKAAPKEAQRYDLVLVAVGRSPNGKKIAADKAGVAVTDRGFIHVDKQMRTNVAHIFAIGDIIGNPMLAHKAVHEGHVAAEAAKGEKSFFDARQIPSVAYTDPEVAWAGKTEIEAKAEGIKYSVGKFPWSASGRAIANGRDEGFTKLIFDDETHRIIGGGIVGTHAGDLIGEVCLAIEMGADAVDIGKTIHPHPTLGESVGMAAEVWEGVCTDLPPVKKK
jgi:dihydrolipoamide dehydrogenase